VQFDKEDNNSSLTLDVVSPFSLYSFFRDKGLLNEHSRLILTAPLLEVLAKSHFALIPDLLVRHFLETLDCKEISEVLRIWMIFR